MKLLLILQTACSFSPAAAFASTKVFSGRLFTHLSMKASQLLEPTQRDAKYAGNIAQYLVDLHDQQATFDFCGGMMFQLVLSGKLYEHLNEISKKNELQPTVFDKRKCRMHQIPGYEQNADADNFQVFHGREIRRVPHASGGMGFVLQLSMADASDAEGWTMAEVAGYDGWGHDVGRDWRTGKRLEQEGFKNFRELFGPDSFALHHRFYLHYDAQNRLWLSAEDGCKGTPAAPNPVQSFLRKLL